MPKTKELKRQEAEERALAHASRSPQEQIQLAQRRPGASERECEKLRDLYTHGCVRIGRGLADEHRAE